MSEFTAGVLFLKPNLERVEQAMQGFTLPFIVRPLNDQWGALFVEGDHYERPPVQPKLVKLSQQLPLLFFQNPEDHGWGYSVYNKGEEAASLWVSYELDWNLTINLARQRYPNIEPYDPEFLFGSQWKALQAELLASSDYRDRVAQQYNNRNLAALRLFGIDTEAIQKLEAVITPEIYFNDAQRLDQVNVFQDVLDIKEMSWMSYHYLEKRNHAE